MKKRWILSTLILNLFLCLPLAYCQELSNRELQIFYDAAESELQAFASSNIDSLQDFASKYGLTQDELDDIVDRGSRMPLSTKEEEVADELEKRISVSIEKERTLDDINIMKELANKYGMSLGQVASIVARMVFDE